MNFGELMEEGNETKSITQTSQKLIKTLLLCFCFRKGVV